MAASSMAASSTSSTSTTLPPSLAFLVSNFHSLSGLRLKGDVAFEELTSILTAEESQIQKAENLSSAKVFVTTHKLNDTVIQGQLPNVHQSSSSAQMYQNSQGPGPYFPQQYYSNSNRNMSFNGGFSKGRGTRGSGFGQNQKPGCQICGKTNHTAFYCYHRQNMEFQPPSFMPPPIGRPMFQQGSSGHHVNHGMNTRAMQPPQANMLTFSSSNGSTGYGSGSVSAMKGQQSFPAPFEVSEYPNTSAFGHNSYTQSPDVFSSSNHSGHHVANMVSAPSYPGANMVHNPSTNWFFDSGASAHVTNDLSNLTQRQSCASGDGVFVGNGSSIPVTYSGQTFPANTSQGTMSSGVVSNHELL
ncbi:hypothetical protein Vadar_001947 [Vaccinium darrowii]|uniref:Uncharacterized protein n=1 Tax=Vaccinium darrowii TaxID=229202 RepID=A0ACB7XMX9_9ERIC|nr:hypothetical protein Vadar_001947 [Vaccinium darrowii]